MVIPFYGDAKGKSIKFLLWKCRDNIRNIVVLWVHEVSQVDIMFCLMEPVMFQKCEQNTMQKAITLS